MNRRSILLLAGLTGLGLPFLYQRLSQSGGLHLLAQSPADSLQSSFLTSPDLRFLAIGDFGTGDANQSAVADAMVQFYRQYPYPLVLLAGDNIYPSGDIDQIQAAFEIPYGPLLNQHVEFRAALGNHDIRTAEGEPQVNYPQFHMSGRYYSFQQGPVQFFALNTNPGNHWPGQLEWLAQTLAQSQSPWKVGFGHHPIYSSGHYGTNPELVARLTPLFKQYGVQLYINGHEHDYERTQPIDGTTYLITGIGGAKLRPVGHSAWTAQAASVFGFSVLEVKGNQIQITAVNTRRQVFDQGVIQRSAT